MKDFGLISVKSVDWCNYYVFDKWRKYEKEILNLLIKGGADFPYFNTVKPGRIEVKVI